jgi:hypothetical protein
VAAEAELEGARAELGAARAQLGAERSAHGATATRAEAAEAALARARDDAAALGEQLDARVLELAQVQAAQRERERAAVAVVGAAQAEVRQREAELREGAARSDAQRAEMERLQLELERAELLVKVSHQSSVNRSTLSAEQLQVEGLQCELLEQKQATVRLEQWQAAARREKQEREAQWERERHQILNDVVAGGGAPTAVLQERIAERDARTALTAQGLRKLRGKSLVLQRHIAALASLITTQLEGGAPDMALLFDDPERRLAGGAGGAGGQQAYEGDGGEEQAEPLAVLRAMERVEADVVALRGRIADHYAENIGNECSTQ